LLSFADSYAFVKLTFDQEDVDKTPSGNVATVKFTATLQKNATLQNNGSARPAEDLKEISTFIKTNGQWLYKAKLFCQYEIEQLVLLLIFILYADAEFKSLSKSIEGDIVKPSPNMVKTLKKGVSKGN
jgi:UPF0225 domain